MVAMVETVCILRYGMDHSFKLWDLFVYFIIQKPYIYLWTCNNYGEGF